MAHQKCHNMLDAQSRTHEELCRTLEYLISILRTSINPACHRDNVSEAYNFARSNMPESSTPGSDSNLPGIYKELVQICLLDEEDSLIEGRLIDCLGTYGRPFAMQLFDFFSETGRMRDLFESSFFLDHQAKNKEFSEYLLEFLQERPNYLWLHLLQIGEKVEAARTLLGVAIRERDSTRRKRWALATAALLVPEDSPLHLQIISELDVVDSALCHVNNEGQWDAPISGRLTVIKKLTDGGAENKDPGLLLRAVRLIIGFGESDPKAWHSEDVEDWLCVHNYYTAAEEVRKRNLDAVALLEILKGGDFPERQGAHTMFLNKDKETMALLLNVMKVSIDCERDRWDFIDPTILGDDVQKIGDFVFVKLSQRLMSTNGQTATLWKILLNLLLKR